MLPNTYWQLEYIESTGTQWINTQHKPTGNTKLEIDFQITQTSFDSTYGNGVAFVEFASSAGNRFGVNVASSIAIACGGTTTLATIPTDRNRHQIIVNDNGDCYADGVLVGTRTFTATSNYNLPFFVNVWGGGNTRYISMRLYGASLYESGTNIRKFTPAMRKSDSVVGLYDETNDVFYTNNGSGTFISGPLVDAPLNIVLTDNPLSFTANDDVALIANFERTANCRYKVNGEWKVAMMYVKVNGEWVTGATRVKVNGTWKNGS